MWQAYALACVLLAASPRVAADANATGAAGVAQPATKADRAPPPDAVRAANSVDYFSDEPPPTSYDRLGQQESPAMAPETMGLMRQLGRTVMALLGTCALIYLLFKLVMPRLVRLWAPSAESTLKIRERLLLDGKSSLMRIEAQNGTQYLLAVGEHGVSLLDKELGQPQGMTEAPSAGRKNGRPFAAELHSGGGNEPKDAT